MKKLIALITALALLFTCGMTAGLAEDTATDMYDHLTVGNPTPLRGDFTLQLWGKGTSDMDVSSLVNGYNLVTWDYSLNNFDFDKIVVSGVRVTDDAEGNREYRIVLNSNLQYSDGTPITAWDYAFSILLQASPAVTELDGNTLYCKGILGANEYRNSTETVLKGVRVSGDQLLTVTVSGAYRPYYYELNYLQFYPVPISVVAPGCSVRDDGEGIYLEGDMTAEMLQSTLLDPETGYVSHPQIVSGPYKLTSFDGTTVELERNELYIGSNTEKNPMIRYLTYTSVNSDDMIQQLAAGEIDLINKTVKSEAISGGLTLVANGGYGMTAYDRSGSSMIGFCCEKPTVSEKEVRKAIACCLDKEKLITDYAGYYGIRADGYYGIGQWMYEAVSGSQEPASGIGNEIEELSMEDIPTYECDPERANALLDQAGWTLNKDGNPYTGAAGEIRCKEINGELVALELLMVCPNENNLGRKIKECMDPALAQAGISLEIREVPWDEISTSYYTNEDRDCDMFVVGINFDAAFDTADSFNPDDLSANYTRIRDDELYQKIKDINTVSKTAGEYINYWYDFQETFVEVLPMIPLYSNIYFDFYTDCLHDYYPDKVVTWGEAMMNAFLSDPNVLPEEME